jgi:hypothetical protein
MGIQGEAARRDLAGMPIPRWIKPVRRATPFQRAMAAALSLWSRRETLADALHLRLPRQAAGPRPRAAANRAMVVSSR